MTDFNRRVFDFIKDRISLNADLEMTAFNEVFNSAEMGRITGILNDFAAFKHDMQALDDYIKILNEYRESDANTTAGSMSADELLAFAQKQKEKKSK